MRMDPGLPEAHLLSGYLNFKLLHMDEAIAGFEKTIELDPLNFDAHLYLGSIYNGNANPSLGVEYLTRAMEIAKTPEEISNAFTHRGLSHARPWKKSCSRRHFHSSELIQVYLQQK